MRVRAVAIVAALVACVGVTPGHVAAVPRATSPLAPPAAPIPTRHVTSIPHVGAIFPNVLNLARTLPVPHVCSGSVVHSASGDVVITAAHCIVGNGQGFAFAPGYHDGMFPYGLWPVRHVHVNAAWVRSHDPRHDYAFLTVTPQRIGGKVRTLESVAGSFTLGTAPAPHTGVTMSGYVLGSKDEPLTCSAPAYRTDGYPSLDCTGFADGTSGGPWVVGTHVVGVIGGLHQGGCTPDISYTAPFGSDVLSDLASTSTTHGDIITSRSSDGC
jgi:hypothetical protein